MQLLCGFMTKSKKNSELEYSHRTTKRVIASLPRNSVVFYFFFAIVGAVFILTIIFFSMFFVSTQKTSAVGNSFFPGSQRMQPPPAGINANISNNVNSTGTVAPDITIQPPKPGEIVPPMQQDSGTSFFTIIKWFVVILLIIGTPLYFLTRKIEK